MMARRAMSHAAAASATILRHRHAARDRRAAIILRLRLFHAGHAGDAAGRHGLIYIASAPRASFSMLLLSRLLLLFLDAATAI